MLALISRMAQENPLWGNERIRVGLLKPGLAVSNRSIRRYRWRRPGRPPSQAWRTFLRNHAPAIWAADLLVVQTLVFVPSDDALLENERSQKRLHVQPAAASGEPWLGSLRPNELCARMRDPGVGRVVHVTPEEANARYVGGRRDGMRVGPCEQLIMATA